MHEDSELLVQGSFVTSLASDCSMTSMDSETNQSFIAMTWKQSNLTQTYGPLKDDGWNILKICRSVSVYNIKSIWVPRFITENFTKVAWQPRNVSTLRKSIERLFLDQDGGKVPQTSPWKLGKKVHGNHWEDANLERITFKETVDRRVEFLFLLGVAWIAGWKMEMKKSELEKSHEEGSKEIRK